MDSLYSSISFDSPRQLEKVNAYLSGSESPSDEGSDLDESLGVISSFPPQDLSEMPQDYLSVLKAAKFLKTGDQNVVSMALGCIVDSDLLNPNNLTAVCDLETMEKIVNLAQCNNLKCRISALSVLEILTQIEKIAILTVNLGIVPICVKLLGDISLDVKKIAATILCNVGHLRRAEKACRRSGGIHLLVALLYVKKEILLTPKESLTNEEKNIIAVTCCCAGALCILAVFSKNKDDMHTCGIIPLISRILVSGNLELCIAVSGVLAECSKEVYFQKAIETEGIVGVLLDCLTRGNRNLEWSCLCVLMRASGENATVRDMIRFHDGLQTIVQRIKSGNKNDKILMAAALGAFWKSAISEKNVQIYEGLGGVELLLPFVADTDMEVQISAVGGLAEMAKRESSRRAIVSSNVIPKIVGMLIRRNPQRLANAAQCLGRLALNHDGMEMIQDNDGVRLLWSLLSTQDDRDVTIKALWAIKSTVTRARDPGELIRELTGSLELLVDKLKNRDCKLLTAVCAVIAEVALDYENLGVMSEQGLIHQLTRLANHTLILPQLVDGDNSLFRELCSAITNCCLVPQNLAAFARMNIIPLLSTFLHTKNRGLLEQVCRCFYTLSRYPLNCVVMHSCGAVPILLCATHSKNRNTQISAAGCIANIRRTLLKADYRSQYDLCMKPHRRSILKRKPQGPRL